MQLGGNQYSGRGSALTRCYKGEKLSASDLGAVKDFFRLPRTATPTQVAFVAAAVTHQSSRRKKTGSLASTQPQFFKAKRTASHKLPQFFKAKTTAPPKQHEDDALVVGPMACSHCSGVQMKTVLKRPSAKERIGRTTMESLLAAHRYRLKNNSGRADEDVRAMVLECEADRKLSKKLTPGWL